MAKYEVCLPDGIRLHVELHGDPVHFSFLFNNNDELKFSYIPGADPAGSVSGPTHWNRDTGAENLSATQKRFVFRPTPAGPALRFNDPAGTDPMVPE